MHPQATVPAEHLVQLLLANVDNNNLSDEAFRQVVRNSLPLVNGVLPKTSSDSNSQFDMMGITQR